MISLPMHAREEQSGRIVFDAAAVWREKAQIHREKISIYRPSAFGVLPGPNDVDSATINPANYTTMKAYTPSPLGVKDASTILRMQNEARRRRDSGERSEEDEVPPSCSLASNTPPSRTAASRVHMPSPSTGAGVGISGGSRGVGNWGGAMATSSGLPKPVMQARTPAALSKQVGADVRSKVGFYQTPPSAPAPAPGPVPWPAPEPEPAPAPATLASERLNPKEPSFLNTLMKTMSSTFGSNMSLVSPRLSPTFDETAPDELPDPVALPAPVPLPPPGGPGSSQRRWGSRPATAPARTESAPSPSVAGKAAAAPSGPALVAAVEYEVRRLADDLSRMSRRTTDEVSQLRAENAALRERVATLERAKDKRKGKAWSLCSSSRSKGRHLSDSEQFGV